MLIHTRCTSPARCLFCNSPKHDVFAGMIAHYAAEQQIAGWRFCGNRPWHGWRLINDILYECMKLESGFLRCGLKLCFQRGRMIDAFKSSWLLLPALLITLPVHATTYYVATNGNDSWTGTSPTHVSGMTGPFADFAKFNY